MRRSRFGGALAVIAAGAMLLVGCAADGSGTGEPGLPAVEPAPVLSADELDVYGGVARVTFASSCTATLIETGVDTAPAYVITNGHCVGLDGAQPNATLVDEEGFGEAHFFDVDGAAEADVLTVPAVRYEYGTMRGVDIGVVRLDATLGELRSAGAVPLPIADTVASDVPVVNIAAPTQTLEPDDWVLRKGECTLGGETDVVEFRWIWLDALRNDCPGVLGGSSGSPLIAGGELVSVLNTTNTGVPAERGDTCYLGKPCEIDESGPVFVPDTSYGSPIAGVGACFIEGVFALGGDCPLEVTWLHGLDGGGIFGPDGVDGGGFTPELVLRSDVDTRLALVQDLSLADARKCTEPATYADAPVFTVPASGGVVEEFDADAEGDVDETTDEVDIIVPITLPRENGFVLACVATPGDEELAARFVFVVDAIAPTEGPQFGVESFDDGGAMVDPLFDLPDISAIAVLHGPADEVDCSDREAYQPYMRMSYFLEKDDLPARFCAIGYDMAGNASPVSEIVVERG